MAKTTQSKGQPYDTISVKIVDDHTVREIEREENGSRKSGDEKKLQQFLVMGIIDRRVRELEITMTRN